MCTIANEVHSVPWVVPIIQHSCCTRGFHVGHLLLQQTCFVQFQQIIIPSKMFCIEEYLWNCISSTWKGLHLLQYFALFFPKISIVILHVQFRSSQCHYRTYKFGVATLTKVNCKPYTSVKSEVAFLQYGQLSFMYTVTLPSWSKLFPWLVVNSDHFWVRIWDVDAKALHGIFNALTARRKQNTNIIYKTNMAHAGSFL